MQQNTEVITQWTESAHYWEKHRDIIRNMEFDAPGEPYAPMTRLIEQTLLYLA